MKGEEWYLSPVGVSNSIHLGERDLAVLHFLAITPATASQIQIASVTFPEGPFRDERRVRERLQSLSAAELVRTYPLAVQSGGMSQYYRLAPDGFRAIHPDVDQQPPRASIAEIAPSRITHAMALADIIVQTVIACHAARVRIVQVHGDGRLNLTIGEYRQFPDCHFQFESGGKFFNVLFEIDNGTEPLESARIQGIESKLLGYEAYQDWVLNSWRELGKKGVEPRFRVIFLTTSRTRANHILWLAQQSAKNPDRRLCLAATQAEFLAQPNAVTEPILNDHYGQWHSIINIHPTAGFIREPIRLSVPVATGALV